MKSNIPQTNQPPETSSLSSIASATEEPEPSSPFLSVIIPTYNEGRIIQNTLHEITAFLADKEYSSEIIVSDDGSTDGTIENVKSLQSGSDLETRTKSIKLLELQHFGKGHAVKAGLLEAKGTFVIFMDADLSTPVEEIDNILHELQQGAEIAIGSRRMTELPGEHRQPIYRHIAGDIFAFVVRIIFLPGIRDPQCGFKGFRLKTARKLAQLGHVNGFAFDTELLYLARKLDIPIKEINVIWRDSGNSSINLFKHGFQMLTELIKIKLHNSQIT